MYALQKCLLAGLHRRSSAAQTYLKWWITRSFSAAAVLIICHQYFGVTVSPLTLTKHPRSPALFLLLVTIFLIMRSFHGLLWSCDPYSGFISLINSIIGHRWRRRGQIFLRIYFLLWLKCFSTRPRMAQVTTFLFLFVSISSCLRCVWMQWCSLTGLLHVGNDPVEGHLRAHVAGVIDGLPAGLQWKAHLCQLHYCRLVYFWSCGHDGPTSMTENVAVADSTPPVSFQLETTEQDCGWHLFGAH